MASNSERNPIDALAEEFADRYRRGEAPSLTEYTRKYPDLADEIQELFPTLVVMEQLKPGDADASADLDFSDGKRPERIGDYRILRKVGRGGMGIVYEAEQVSLGRHVALKVVPVTEFSDPVYLERFRREARAAAALHHTNIVPVFGVGEGEGALFYAMQFIHGEGLDRVLHDVRLMRGANGPSVAASGESRTGAAGSVAQSLVSGCWSLPAARVENSNAEFAPPAAEVETGADRPAESAVSLSSGDSVREYYRSVARVGLQVAEALAYAHKQGILHRDIKPSNLLLDVQGTVWITDFGLAKSEGGEDLTQTGDIVGTIRYMAPERFEGDSLPQSDVYGLGVTLFEMLALRPAFDDSNRARLIERIGRDSAPLLRKYAPQIPRDLETIVQKCIARHPHDRYASADDVAEDLRRFLSDRTILARRTSTTERLWRWGQRNPVVAGLSGGLAILLVVLLVGSWIAALVRQERDRALVNLERAEAAEASSRALQAEIKIREHLARAGAFRRSRHEGQRFNSLAEIRAAMQLQPSPELRQELRSEAIAALALPDICLEEPTRPLPSDNRGFDFSPASATYASTDSLGNCYVRRLTDDHELARVPGLGQPAIPWLSPDARFVAVHNHERVQLCAWALHRSCCARRKRSATLSTFIPPSPSSPWPTSTAPLA